MNEHAIATWVLGGSGGLALLAFVANMLLRQYNATSHAGSKGKAEVDFITALREENKLLRERNDVAYHERNEAMLETARLRGQVELLTRDLAHLQRQADMLQERLQLLGGGNP